MSASAAGRTMKRDVSRIGVPLEVLYPSFELSLLGLGQRNVRSLRRDAVPEILGELNAFGDGELAEVELRVSHDASFLRRTPFPQPLSVPLTFPTPVPTRDRRGRTSGPPWHPVIPSADHQPPPVVILRPGRSRSRGSDVVKDRERRGARYSRLCRTAAPRGAPHA